MSASLYILVGYPQYYFIGKQLYRKAYVTANMQYRAERAIARAVRNGIEGYYLIKWHQRKFVTLSKLKHKLKKVNTQ